MRKPNIIVAAILIIASVAFLGLWYFLKFNLVDNPVDLVATIVWWAVIAISCVAIHIAEKKRQEKIRTAYIADALLFNPEAGMVNISNSDTTQALSRVLNNLQYSFDLQELDEYSVRPVFKYVVTTSKYADNGSTWEGQVASVVNPNALPVKFSNREELARAIA